MSKPFVQVYSADNLQVMQQMDDGYFDLIYMDPPFNTGKTQTLESSQLSYRDAFEDYEGFLYPRLVEARRVLAPNGSLFVHLDYREVHYVKVMLDGIFGRECFINEIIWSYDYGARSRSRWSTKHDNILWYARNPKDYCFNYDVMERIPYMAPSLVGAEKAAIGKTPTDVWWNTIVPTNGKERTGYPTQKPLGILNRIVQVHSNPGDALLDPFAGSGSFGEAALAHGRSAVLIDQNPQAFAVMRERLARFEPEFIG
jgi:site-specific DNA-methyltransferase (adenine-specific)